MTRDEVVALFHRRQAALDRLDAAALAGLHAEDGVLESPFGGGTAEGREAIELIYRTFFTAFDTVTFDQKELLIEGDRAAALLHVHGTDRGGVLGLPPTGRPFSLSMVSLFELRDGLIAKERRIYDFTGLLVQVGAIKAKLA